MRIDSDLTFKEHVTSICSKANQKLHAYTTVSNGLTKAPHSHEVVITSQFNYCPIVCMCHGRTLNIKVNPIHERALGRVYRYFQSICSALLVENNSFTIHQKNLELLARCVFKVSISPQIMSEMFVF